MKSVFVVRVRVMLVASCLFCLMASASNAQKGSPKTKQPNLTVLDNQLKDAQEAFMKTSAELAKEYEDLGELEKAQDVLKSMLRLSPDLKPIQDKIKELEEIRISQNNQGVDVEPGRGWVQAQVAVQKGKTMRFLAEGECRITVSQMVGPDGIASEDIKTDLVSDVPLGGLMGLIVDNKGKSGKPFLIGQQTELEADTTGLLMLKVNVPPTAKTTGKFRVQVMGDIALPDKSSSR